jgi:anti-anti-sigma factor
MTSAPLLDFTVSSDPDGTTVLHVSGEADLATAQALRERLLTEFARHDRLVLDLSRAMLYDGAALRALHALHREAVRTRREPPALRGVRPTLAKALKATGLHNLFPQQAHPPFPRRTARLRPHPRPMPAVA